MILNLLNKDDIELIKWQVGKDANVSRKEAPYIPADGMVGWWWGRFGNFIIHSLFFCVKRWVRGTVFYFLAVNVKYTQTEEKTADDNISNS